MTRNTLLEPTAVRCERASFRSAVIKIRLDSAGATDIFGVRMSTREILMELAEKLPPEATLADAMHELEFRQAVEAGLASLDRGEGVPLEEVRKRIPEWVSKYSSPKKP